MITIICGAPGAGKTALMAHFASQYLVCDDDYDLMLDKVNLLNESGWHLSIPQHLVFSDFKLQSYGQESYFVNGFYLGMPNGQHPTMFLPPCSKVFLSEAQRYYDSRKFASFSDFVSQFYEQHRHWGMQIFLDCQRDGLVDLNIRGIVTRVLYVNGMTNDVDSMGRIMANYWHVRQFSSADECDRWLGGDKILGVDVEIAHNNQIVHFPQRVFRDTPQFASANNFKAIKSGATYTIPHNIFDNYNSTNKQGLFLRGRQGHDFSLYRHPSDDAYMYDLPPIYSNEAPRTFYKLPEKELQKLDTRRVLTI